ncbi:MAG TPA: hypothetical protein PK031_04965 [Pseudomonadales bacterium]|nr:hypothetical protein [Pseudomonadales bacterium]
MGRKTTSLKARNRHAINPLMAKGGRHEKSTGAKRAADKRATRSQLAKPTADFFMPLSYCR